MIILNEYHTRDFFAKTWQSRDNLENTKVHVGKSWKTKQGTSMIESLIIDPEEIPYLINVLQEAFNAYCKSGRRNTK